MFSTLFTGRLNRKQYICRYLATIAISIIVLCIVVATSDINWESPAESMDKLNVVPLYVLSVIANLAAFSFDLRRIHDVNLPSQLILLPIIVTIASYIPFFNDGTAFYGLYAIELLFFLFLCIRKGTPGDNQYGVQP